MAPKDTKKSDALSKQKSQVIMVDPAKRTLRLGSGRHADSQGGEALQSMLQSSLCDWVEHLLEHPERILIVEKYAKTDSNFIVEKATPRDWFHATLIYLSSISKEFWLEVLKAYFKHKGGPLAEYTDDDWTQ